MEVDYRNLVALTKRQKPRAPHRSGCAGLNFCSRTLEDNMTPQELKTAVIIGWLCPALVILIIAWPKVAALLALTILAWLAWGWWKDLRG